MTPAVAPRIDSPLAQKKTMRKKVVTDEKKTTVKVPADKPKKKVVEKVVADKPQKKAPAAKTKKAVEKDAPKKSKGSNETEEKAVKTPKHINTKPTIADNQGLNLSVAKVKNIISNYCINKEINMALNDINVHTSFDDENQPTAFSLDSLSEDTLSLVDKCYSNSMDAGANYAQNKINALTKDKRDKYNELKQEAIASFQKTQKGTSLFSQDKFDMFAFNKSYDKDFYKDSKSDVSGEWKRKLKNKELHSYCVNLLTKSKVRFNSESKVFITAFVECIVRQLIVNGTVNCIDDKKKIIRLDHALDNISPSFTLFPFIASTDSYKKYILDRTDEASEESDAMSDHSDDDQDQDMKAFDASKRRLQFKYYVAELCRDVRMDLSKQDDGDYMVSSYNQTSVSKLFNQFCSNAITDLLQIFGKMLKVEVVTRDVKTVNYSIISSLVLNSHILYNIDSLDTIKFIQDKYTKHNEFLKRRQDERETKVKK